MKSYILYDARAISSTKEAQRLVTADSETELKRESMHWSEDCVWWSYELSDDNKLVNEEYLGTIAQLHPAPEPKLPPKPTTTKRNYRMKSPSLNHKISLWGKSR